MAWEVVEKLGKYQGSRGLDRLDQNTEPVTKPGEHAPVCVLSALPSRCPCSSSRALPYAPIPESGIRELLD